MRRIAALSLIVAVTCVQVRAEANSWNKIRYSGGTVVAKVNQFDWNTSLTVTSDSILFDFGRRQTFKLAPADVAVLSYGREAHRRVADMVALGILVSPLALFGLLHKSKNHFIGIEYRTADGKPGALLLEADKGSYRAILRVLKTVTGKPVQNEPQ